MREKSHQRGPFHFRRADIKYWSRRMYRGRPPLSLSSSKILCGILRLIWTLEITLKEKNKKRFVVVGGKHLMLKGNRHFIETCFPDSEKRSHE